MAAVSAGMIHTLQHSATESRVKIQEETSDDDLLLDESHHSRDESRSDGSPSSRNPESPKMDLETTKTREEYIETSKVLEKPASSEKNVFSSPFLMQNMLKMKAERDSVSPEVNRSSQGVFSTDKLLQNTPDYELSLPREVHLARQEKPPDYNSDPQYSPNYRNDSRSCPTSSPRYENIDSDNQGYSNTDSVRGDITIDDEISCCSEDTVLSVGNEVPLPGYNHKSPDSVVSNDNLIRKTNPSSPVHNLTSFKHIQTHLNAISQLSQNLNLNQPLLLRPNPIPPNPLLFLNQTHLLFGGNRLQNSLNPVEHLTNQKHLNPGREIQQNGPPPTSPTTRLGINPNFGHSNHPGVNPISLRQYKQASHIDSHNSNSHMNFQSFKGLNRSFEEVSRRKSVSCLDTINNDDTRHREAILNHQTSLKFSIDNILKADFGRRITDPLNKKTKSNASLTKSRSNLISNQSAFTTTQDSTPKTSLLKVNSQSRESAFSVKVSENTRPSLDNRIPDSEQKSSANSSAVSEKGGAIDLSKSEEQSGSSGSSGQDGSMVWPAWVYCTRYSDRPSSGPRTRRPKKPPGERSPAADEKRPRTAFSGPQLARLKHEFTENRYLTERRRQQLASELGLAEAQIKIWFQNKRAKIKKASGQRNPLALQLMAQGLYNHSTVPLTREEEELQELQARETRDKNMHDR